MTIFISEYQADESRLYLWLIYNYLTLNTIDTKEIIINLIMEGTSPKLDIEKATAFVYDTFDKSVLPSIMDFIRIPNLSRNFDPEWATNGLLTKAAEHIKAWIESLNIKGLKSEVITLEGKSPIVYT